MKKANKVLIKGMVCQRCITTVKDQLESAGLELEDINLGEVTLATHTSLPDAALIEQKLSPLGFSLLEDKKAKLVKEVKSLVGEVYNGVFDFPNDFRFSVLAAERLGKDYDTISTTFSSMENNTLEKYIINFRVEKIKELMVYTDDTLADISFKLGFSSVAHLSRQFKEQTGMTPSHFKQLRKNETETGRADMP
ncbi:MAG TPA: AraC family transcriptional regulator [Chitinophagaceae bacterium]|nr:AraC family transcriptional regulator [Chitinophagaceae bacterium]